MSPALLASLFAILGAALAAHSAATVVLWRRVRALTPGPDAAARPPTRARSEFARRLDDLDGRHRALEVRIDRVEAAATRAAGTMPAHPAGPRVRRRPERGGADLAGGAPLISVPNLAGPTSPASDAAAGLDRRFGAVWALAEAGAPIEVVARESGYPIGQVELILGLRRQLLAAEAGPP